MTCLCLSSLRKINLTPKPYLEKKKDNSFLFIAFLSEKIVDGADKGYKNPSNQGKIESWL
jgi:hypothetical protein